MDLEQHSRELLWYWARLAGPAVPRLRDKVILVLREPTSTAADYARLFQEINSVASNTAEDEQAQPETTLPVIGKSAVLALRKLQMRHPAECTLDDFDNNPHKISRPTAVDAVKELIAAGYAVRLRGDQAPASITPLGMQAAQQLPPS